MLNVRPAEARIPGAVLVDTEFVAHVSLTYVWVEKILCSTCVQLLHKNVLFLLLLTKYFEMHFCSMHEDRISNHRES